MPKKGGKKSKGKKTGGGGGAASKLPDVKNIISPAHEQEDKLLYGEGTAAEAAEAAPATASGSAAVSDTAPATAAPLEPTGATETESKPPASTIVPEKEKEEKDLPVRAKTDVATEQRGDAGTEALAAAAPTTSKKQAKKQKAAEEAKAAEPERPTTAGAADKADLLTDTTKKAEQPAVPETTNGISKDVPEAAKKEQIPSSGLAAAAAAVAYTGGKEKTQPAAPGLDKTDAAKEAQGKPTASVADSENKAIVQEEAEATPVAPAAPLVAPHVKRSHEVPIFVTQDRDQPPKKPRVDEPSEGSSLAIPGRFPSPSVAGSTDSAVAPETQDAGKDVLTTPKAAAPTEAAVSAPAAKPVPAKDTTKSTTVGTDKASAATEKQRVEAAAAAQKETTDASARPIKPAPKAQPQPVQPAQQPQAQALVQAPQEQQVPADKAAVQQPAQPAQQEAAAQKEAKKEKGGFVSWIKRKFKGDKKAEPAVRSTAS